MIKFLFDTLFNFFLWFASKFPEANPAVGPAIQYGIYNVKTYMVPFNWFFPVDFLFLAINIFIISYLAIILFLLTRWIVSFLTLGHTH